MAEPESIPIAIAGVSHHTSNVAAIEAFRFASEPEFLAEAGRHFPAVMLLQTCNRVEIFVEGDVGTLKEFLARQARRDYFVHEGKGALRHLFALASGIDSMIVGEDQIIGQLKKALADAQENQETFPDLPDDLTFDAHLRPAHSLDHRPH